MQSYRECAQLDRYLGIVRPLNTANSESVNQVGTVNWSRLDWSPVVSC
jgi:hypothetical protein